MQPERRAVRERSALELAGDAVLVEPVAALVHRPEKPVEVVLEVARRQTDVGDRDRGRERVDSGVEAPLRRVEAEALDHLQLELLLPLDREGHAAYRPFSLCAGGGDQRDLLFLEPLEDGAHLGRLHAGLEVVEQDVVGLVVVVEALDVLAAQVEVVAERGQELREVRVLSRLDPHGHRERGGARHLTAQLGRHAACLLPVAADEPDQARLVRVVRLRLFEARQLVEQPSHLVGRERLVRDPVEGRELLGPDAGASGRHLDLLVPAEERRRAVEILDLADALFQLREGGVHVPQPYAPQSRRGGEPRRWSSNPGAKRPFRGLGADRDLLPQIPILLRPKKTRGPEGELRGRPPPPHAVLWCRRRTGSESVDGRARTRQRQE